jgi:predicted nucleotide-binding protein (sugar kinase/HSP70/actin superfamily)
VEYFDQDLPRVGIIGEIFMKYNSHGNFNTLNWLRDHGMEVVTSPLNTFFIESLVDVKFNHKNNVEKAGLIELMFHKIIEKRVGRYIDNVNEILGGFNHKLSRIHRIDEIEQQAKKVVSLIHQYGEGWLLPGEMLMYAEDGIKNVLSFQPFGCIACHVVSKGVSKRIRELYPDINLLILDFDADTSKANIHNRLEFFVKNAKSAIESKQLH